uniref:Uncharacterized protein n=1 Tax=Caenorhabditis japonica TaxID=281687 RepID=A0A8R1I2Q0_CAEJA
MPRKIDLFNDIIYQSTTVSSPPKCQCLPPSTPKTLPNCIPYDSRLQAASLEEAIVAFPDLTITRHEKPSTAETLNNCKTKQCRDCYKDLRSQLRKVGLLPGTIDKVFSNQRNFTTCQKYRFTMKEKGVYEKKKKKVKQHFEWDYDDYDEDEEDYYFDGTGKKNKKEHYVIRKVEKRDVEATTAISQPNTTAMNSTGIIGIRFPISCTTRGVTPDGLGTVSLCSTCWVWRRLPSSYYPAYLNEVVCDYADTSCLSGYASCQTGTQQLNVLRNDSGKLVPVSVSAGINCECRISEGSALESLVLGQGSSAAFPPVETSTKQPLMTTTTGKTIVG